MKTIIIAVIVVVAVAILFVTCRGGEDASAPANPQSIGMVDGIQMQLDFKAKASAALKIETQWNAARQLLAMDAVDGEALRTSMDSYAALQIEIASTRQQLKSSGMSDKDIDDWLTKNHWDELGTMIATLKDRPAQQ